MQRPHGGARNFTTPPDPAPNPRHAAARLPGSAVGRETATRTRTAGAVGVSPEHALFSGVAPHPWSPPLHLRGNGGWRRRSPLARVAPPAGHRARTGTPGASTSAGTPQSLSCGGLAPGARERSERRARPCPLDTSSRTAPGGSWNPQPFFLFYFLLPFLFSFFFFSGMYITYRQQQTVQILKARLECLPVFRRMSPFPHQDDTSLHQPAPF